MMECAGTWDRLSAYLDGDLPEKEREGIAQHLRQCARCAEEEKSLKETISLLRNLPAGPAPPELIEGVRLRIGNEREKTPLWKKLFLPAHIKIPLEAAAVVLAFLLVYGVQKEMPSSTPPPPPASVGSGHPETAAATREIRQKAEVPARPPAGGSDRKANRETGKEETPRRITAAMPEEKKPADEFAPRREKSTGPARTDLPSVPATRVSTGGGSIGTAFPGPSQAEEDIGPRIFSRPESRLLRLSPYEKEVTIEVPSGDRAGIADRIADAALRLGGTFRREITFVPGRFGAGETPPFREIIRVVLPVDRAGGFLAELEKMGTVPPEETPGPVDPPAGPAPDTVAYTVRIRVR
jgi:hypothetical protein